MKPLVLRLKKARLFISVLFLVLVSCEPRPVYYPTDSDQCPAACAKLQKLGCEEGSDLSDGTTCVQFCEKTQAYGHALRPTCVVDKVEACSDMIKCQ